MLDVKRLYWNTRAFRGVKRKGKCPYEHLGLKLASYDFWSLLKEEFSRALEEQKTQAKAELIARCLDLTSVKPGSSDLGRCQPYRFRPMSHYFLDPFSASNHFLIS